MSTLHRTAARIAVLNLHGLVDGIRIDHDPDRRARRRTAALDMIDRALVPEAMEHLTDRHIAELRARRQELIDLA